METDILENTSWELQISRYQSKLLPYAYNILGDFMEAEDVVQEALNKYYLDPNDHIEKPENYLIRSVINRSINQKKLLRNKKELYPGEWLPTPVFTEEGIYSKADRGQILNYSLLVLLEKLNPRERAVFILKESFDFSHKEIADILEIATENSRQLLKRAKQKLGSPAGSSFEVKDKNAAPVKQLTEAILQADVEKVKFLLSADIQSISDGGPNVSAAKNIITGKDHVSKFLKAIFNKYLPASAKIVFATVNHKPAIIYTYEGRIFRCAIFELKGETIDKIFIVVNPDKLKHLNLIKNASRAEG